MAGIRVIEYLCLVLALLFKALPGLASDDGIGPGLSSDADVLAVEGRSGYSCMLIEYSASGGGRVPAFLLVPDSAATCRGKGLPAVLMLHDHGARFDIGKEKLAKPVTGSVPEHILKSSRQWTVKNFDGVYFADSLASLGYVVLVPDALYWGGRSSADAQRWSELAFGHSDGKNSRDELKTLKTRVYEGQRAVYDSLEARGDVWARHILHDDISALEFLKSLPYIDSGRIGAFGFSMGAHRCWLLSAVRSDIRCGAAVSWMTLKEAVDTSSASSLSMLIPELRSVHDFPDVAAMLYPRPMLFLSGEEDHLFPKNVVSEAYRRMNCIYDFLSLYGDGSGGDTGLRTEFFPGGHNCGKLVQSIAVDFFRLNL